MQDPQTLAALLETACALAKEDRATIDGLQDIIARQAVQIAQLSMEKARLESQLAMHQHRQQADL